MNAFRVGLLGAALALASCSAAAREPDDRLVIRVHHSRFLPDRISVHAGETVRFVIRNDDPIAHEFILGDAEVQRIHELGTERHHGAKPGEISIPAGETRVTTYTFDEPGTLLFGCHLPRHYAYGMKGIVTIE